MKSVSIDGAMADYSKMTQQDFDDHLDSVIECMTKEQLVGLPGVKEILIEEFNNDVLDSWSEANQNKAYPDVDEVS